MENNQCWFTLVKTPDYIQARGTEKGVSVSRLHLYYNFSTYQNTKYLHLWLEYQYKSNGNNYTNSNTEIYICFTGYSVSKFTSRANYV